MASGYFPLNPNFSGPGQKILQALRLLNEAREELRGYSYHELCAEDAVYDGQYLADFERGVDLISSCLEGYVSWQRMADEALRVLNRYLPPDSNITEHDVVNELLGIFDGPMYRAAKSRLPMSEAARATGAAR